jgi:hypothetical protein
MTGETPSTRTADQRAAERRTLAAPLTLRFEVDQLTGESDNISRAGVLFFTDEPLRVTVEVIEDGKPRTLTGRLVRAQRMNDTNTGIAVEFDAQ